MNIAKHMEAIFVAVLAFAGTASFVVEHLPEAQANPIKAETVVATAGGMPVVVVTAKRMSAAQKAESLRAERSAGRI